MSATIINISNSECAKIYPIISKNGADLLKVSNLSAGIGRHGIALSLLILGAEEYVKAIVILLKTNDVRVFDVPEIRQVFRDHKKKHEVATFIELANIIEPLIKLSDWNENRKRRKQLPFWERLMQNLKDLSEALQPFQQISESYNWWEYADEYKKRGFYVDYKNNLQTPNDFIIKDYEQAEAAVKRLIKSYRIINIIFNRSAVKVRKELADTFNNGIKLFNSNPKNQIKTKN